MAGHAAPLRAGFNSRNMCAACGPLRRKRVRPGGSDFARLGDHPPKYWRLIRDPVVYFGPVHGHDVVTGSGVQTDAPLDHSERVEPLLTKLCGR